MTSRCSRIAPALLGLFLALTAFAAGAGLEPEASALVAGYEALEARIDACPDGDCKDREAIEAELSALDLDLADLESERDALQDCSDCERLDALLDDAAVLAAEASEETGTWDSDR